MRELVRLHSGRDGQEPVFALALKPCLQAIHVDVNDWRGEESEHLADDEVANTVMPSGRRSRADAVPRARGNAPKSASWWS